MSALNATEIKSLQWDGKDKLYNCGDNLYINIREKSKTWIWRGTVDGKRVKKTIGDYSHYTLKQAREAAYKLKHEKPEQQRFTFEVLANDYLKETSYKQIARLTERVRYLNSVFGDQYVDEITQFQIVEFVRNYRKKSKSMAGHYLIHINQIFKHGISLGVLESSPSKNIPRLVSGYKPKSKNKTLTNNEIQWLFQQASPNARVLRFQLLTGLRISEALNGKIDGDKYQCIAKGGIKHWVYLTDLAREQLPFPENRRMRTVSEWCRRKFLDYTPHDCRRTYSTIANNEGVEPFIVERVLSHKLQGVMGVYNKAEYEKERTECARVVEAHIKSALKAKD